MTLLDAEGKPNNGPFPASRTLATFDPAAQDVTWNLDAYLYGQFMRFIRPGAVRIGSTEGLGDLANAAFQGPDGTIILVVVNPAREPRAVRVRWSGKEFRLEMGPRSAATCVWMAGER